MSEQHLSSSSHCTPQVYCSYCSCSSSIHSSSWKVAVVVTVLRCVLCWYYCCSSICSSSCKVAVLQCVFNWHCYSSCSICSNSSCTVTVLWFVLLNNVIVVVVFELVVYIRSLYCSVLYTLRYCYCSCSICCTSSSSSSYKVAVLWCVLSDNGELSVTDNSVTEEIKYITEVLWGILKYSELLHYTIHRSTQTYMARPLTYFNLIKGFLSQR